MFRTKDENKFLELQKIPERLEELFETYKRDGNYSELKHSAIDYISRDKSTHSQEVDYNDTIIHSLRLEKAKLKVNNKAADSISTPLGILIISITLTPFFNAVFDFWKDSFSEKTYNIIEDIVVIIAIVMLVFLAINLPNAMKKYNSEKLIEWERKRFLKLCIREYEK